MDRKRVLLVGVGGTGCAVLPYLSASGTANISLMDGDMVQASDLGRQPLYATKDIGRTKVEVAAERSPEQVEIIPEFLDHTNAHRHISGHDLVLDCTDDLHVRFLIDAVCAEHRIPLITGAVHVRQAQVVVLHANASSGPGLKELFPGRVGAEQDGCDMQQVPGAVTGMVGALMALRAIDLLNGVQHEVGVIDLLDIGEGRWSRFRPPVSNHKDDLIASRQ